MAADPMVYAELGTAEAAEIALGPIGRCPILALVLDAVIDPLHRIAGEQDVPCARFVRYSGANGTNIQVVAAFAAADRAFLSDSLFGKV